MALTVRQYVTADGKRPFLEWVRSLTKAVGARIQLRVQRFELGNLGDYKSVGHGVCEARVMFGPGYRIYFGKDGDTIVVLLAGGDKGSQAKDIARAQKFWRDYLEAKKHGKAT
jgi:putative addiction module killer protein